jgi:aryl-alcohol dehydrogenase-like predicted oxidoreductase
MLTETKSVVPNTLEPSLSPKLAASRLNASKLALGTAQFGLAYGVANQAGKISQAEAIAMLALARSYSVDTLDTAIAYGDSEQRLGDIGVSQWQVVSKLPKLPDSIDLASIEPWVVQQVLASLHRLRQPSLAALLLHRPGDLIAHPSAYLAAFDRLKREGLVAAVGVSIYAPGELEAIFMVFQPDVVQAPFNVFDQRLIRSGWLARLAEQGTRVHARSAMLQGLLGMQQARPAWFDRWRDPLERWFKHCEASKIAPAQLAVAFALNQPQIERVVVGADTATQLQALIDASAIPALQFDSEWAIEDLDLIDPSRWKLL